MKILVITPGPIGDTVMVSGTIAYLRQQHPDAVIHLATSAANHYLFAAMPTPVRFIPFDKQSYKRHWLKLLLKVLPQRWDILLDLRRSIAGKVVVARKKYLLHKLPANVHVATIGKVLFGVECPPRIWPEFTNNNLPQQLSQREQISWVGMAIGASRQSRCWPWQRYHELANALLTAYPRAGVIFMGDTGNRKHLDESQLIQLQQQFSQRVIDAVGGYPLNSAVEMLQHCSLVVSNDSGLLHIAAALSRPLIALFGPSNELRTGPFGATSQKQNHVTVIRSARCPPQELKPGQNRSSQSPEMLAIKVETVLAAVEQKLARLDATVDFIARK